MLNSCRVCMLMWTVRYLMPHWPSCPFTARTHRAAVQLAVAQPQNTPSCHKIWQMGNEFVCKLRLFLEKWWRLLYAACQIAIGQTQELTFPVVCRIQFDIRSTSDGVQMSVTLRVYRAIDGSVRLSIYNLVTYSVFLYWYWYVQERAIFMLFKTDSMLTLPVLA